MITKLGAAVTVYKVLKIAHSGERCIAQLTVPSGSFIYSEGRDEANKLRVNMAIVERVWYAGDSAKRPITDPNVLAKIGSAFDRICPYAQNIGKVVFPDGFDFTDKQCSNGIHCFATADEASKYH
jgi:hypothetical protein